MNDNRSIDAIFCAAIEIDSSSDRQAWLNEACSHDAELRRQVDRLLEAHFRGGSILDTRAHAIDATVIQLHAERSGMQIGPYKLIEQIGEGGMGTVWRAQQTEPVKRQVALKFIKAGMDSEQLIARFEAERQALAMMDHGNIARVLDAGATATDRPYFVMELVNGVPITKYCDDNHLTPRQRLELFVPVCQAIQHAHQKGIIHRDIKPSNVLVTLNDSQPVPKVIDFGVAKATAQKLTERTLFTQFGAAVGTLEYMSPEQAEISELGVDTRSDIYSLGVVLYELLTGSTPLNQKKRKEAGFGEILRIIKEEEPPKPSTRLCDSAETLPAISVQRNTEPAKLTKLMQGELDWIVMKTLEKDRNRRYETAKDFAADVQRYLNDEPVQACPPSAGYRFRKFARRNKGRLAAAAVLTVAILVAVGGIGWAVLDRSARETEAARHQAERQAKAAGQVELILGEVDRLEHEQKWPEALAAARRAEAAVDSSEAGVEIARSVGERLKDLEFIDRLEQIRMQRASWIDGKFDNAGAEREFARAFREYGVDVDELAVEASIDRLKTRSALAVPLAAALDDWVDARRLVFPNDAAGWKRLVAVARGIDPEPLRDRLRASWGKPVSEVQDQLRRLAETIDIRAQHPATVGRLVGTLQQVQQSDSALRLLRDAQIVYPADFWLNFRLGNLLQEQKDREGAIRFYTAAVSIRPHSAAAQNNLGNALCVEKRLAEAVAAYRQAIELDSKHAYARFNLGFALREQKKLDEAIVYYRKAIELDRRFVGAYNSLGSALYDQGQLDDAIAAFQKASELDPTNVPAHSNLGIALRKLKKWDEAIAAYKKAITLDPKNADAYGGLGIALHDQKKLDEAVVCYRKAIELDPKLAATHNNLGNALREQNRLDEAIDAHRKAIELDPEFAGAYSNLGIDLKHQMKLDDAIAAFRKAIQLDPKFAVAYSNLGVALCEQNRLDEAIDAHRKAIELDPKHAIAYNNLGTFLCDKRRDYDKAIECFRSVIELEPKYATAYGNLGIALCHKGQLEEAIDALRQAVALDPTYVNAHINLGHSLAKKGKLDEAIPIWKKLVELDPKLVRAHTPLAWHLATAPDPKLRDPQAAVVHAQRVVDLAPTTPNHWSSLGVALLRAGDFKAAVENLEKADQMWKGDHRHRFFLAMAYWRFGDKDKARQTFDQGRQWMDKNQPKNEDLIRFRREAEELMKQESGVEGQKRPSRPEALISSADK